MKELSRRRTGRLLVKVIALVASQLVVHAGPNKGAGNAAFPQVNLPAVAHGHKALEDLGAQLPGVARAYGLREDELQSLVLEDPSLAVDQAGRLHFTDPMPEPGDLPAEPVAVAAAGAAAAIPLADTFKLHSHPSAKRIIYLDFNGQVLSGTGWNNSYNGGRDIVAPPWDIDGDPSTFNDEERTRIQHIWQRVAEDYAPFDVDVTTELTSESQITRSSLTDEYYGTRVLISAISSYFGSYGGIAYVGTFDDIGDQYKPALVFPENLGPNDEKYIAEAASHEAGHNLGLSHDGTSTTGYYTGQGSGVTGWAPIMGAGYYENVTQWSKGEYANANNKQDDLAVMQTYGLPLRPDDYGDTASTASYFPAGTQLTATGVIERSTDVDVFAFTTGAGAISITISPSDLGPNLDIYAELRDAQGTLLATNNPADQLYASFNFTVPAGTYFLHVRGTGLGDPLTTGYTSYASLGQYFISGTVVDPSGAVPPVATATATPTSGMAPLPVQFDGNGSFDQDGTIVSYAWDFGDGTTGTDATVSHIYNAAGTYTASLTVTDNTGLTGTESVSIQAQNPILNTPPVAVATASPTAGTAPLIVTFNGSGSTDLDGSIASYQWNFGDGTSGSGAVVQHTYQSAGTYTATLTVTDNGGLTGTASVSIQVQNPILNTPPVAVITTSQATGTAPVIVTFDGSGSTDLGGSIVSYQWKFGDGASGSGPFVQHTYQNGGTYTATLTVKDNSNLSASTTVIELVTPNPAKVMRVQNLSLAVLKTSGNAVQAYVTVTDLTGKPMPGVKVAGSFDSIVAGNVSANTGTNGVAVLTSKRVNLGGTVTFTVKGLTKSGCTYSASQNLISSATISFAR